MTVSPVYLARVSVLDRPPYSVSIACRTAYEAWSRLASHCINEGNGHHAALVELTEYASRTALAATGTDAGGVVKSKRPRLAYSVTRVDHADYPHPAGYLFDCPACQAMCHCTPGSTECVYEGTHK